MVLSCIEHCFSCIVTRCLIEGQRYTTCGTACPPTCKEPEKIIACTTDCVPGCQCPFGTVLDEENKRCVKPELCPAEEPCGNTYS